MHLGPRQIFCGITSGNVIGFLLHISFLLLISLNLYASDGEERRLQIALSIFPKIVAVDTDIQNKLDENKQVLLAFAFEFDMTKSLVLAKRLKEKIKNIAGFSFNTLALSAKEKLDETGIFPTAIILTEKLSSKSFNKIMEFAKRKQILVFSPYIGDVERGATVGLSITSRVRPYFNMHTLRSSSISINAVLIKVSKRYE